MRKSVQVELYHQFEEGYVFPSCIKDATGAFRVARTLLIISQPMDRRAAFLLSVKDAFDFQ
jgi:hypothetical protein